MLKESSLKDPFLSFISWSAVELSLKTHYKKICYKIAVNLDGPRSCHTEWNKSHRREISCYIPYMQNLKRSGRKNLFVKQKHTQGFREWTYGCGEWWRLWGRERECRIDMSTLLYLKYKTSKSLLHSTGHSAVFCGSLNGRRAWGRINSCVCMVESLCCPLKLSHCLFTKLKQKIKS